MRDRLGLRRRVDGDPLEVLRRLHRAALHRRGELSASIVSSLSGPMRRASADIEVRSSGSSG